MLTAADFEFHIKTESARLVECLRTVHRDDMVPACPRWTAEDLLWHVVQGQRFWTTVVAERLQNAYTLMPIFQTRPSLDDDIYQLCDDATAALLAALDGVADDTPVWTRFGDRDVRGVRRRQAHELLMHRLDAESFTADNAPIDPRLATDGADEALRLVHSGDDYDCFTPDGRTCRITTTDTGASWDLALGYRERSDSFIVTEPGELHSHDLVILQDAAHIDTWLWGRSPISNLELVGDKSLLERVEGSLANEMG